MLHSWRERTYDARKRKRANAAYACSKVETFERKALVALPPCCIGESLKNPKESDGDGWMDGVGRSKVHDPSRFVSPTAIVVFSCRCSHTGTQHREIEYYLFAFVILVH